MKPQLFYPSHDIALGNGLKRFNPPAAALRLQEDLAWLADIFGPQPWGWSFDMRQQLHDTLQLRFSELPSDADLALLRNLSSRATTVQVLEASGYPHLKPTIISDSDTLIDYIAGHDIAATPFVLKTPWSSSGRGLIRSTVSPRSTMMQRALSTINKMGCIVGEEWLDKVQDFAMLFDVEQHGVRFLGYSLFDNDESGTYRQGFLMSNEAIEQRLVASGANADELHQVQTRLIEVLGQLFAPLFGKPWKVGYIGIDMMLYKNETLRYENNINNINNINNANNATSVASLHPCVEMNVRCTMGTVCRLWADQHLAPGETGRFCISPMGNDGHFEAQFIIDKT